MKNLSETYVSEDESEFSNFETWANKNFILEETRDRINKADILFVPIENFKDQNIPLFPQGTDSVFSFVKENCNDQEVEICIEEEDYAELMLHSDLLILGGFIITAIVAPAFVNVISEYIKTKWITKDDEEKQKLKIDITIVKKDGTSKKFKYDGPAKYFEKTFQKILNKKRKSG